MDYKQILNIAVLAGEIMLRSGAETYRVEDTMKHILNTAGTEVAEAFVMMTGIVATLDNQDMEMLTAMRRVHDRGTNMHRIVQVNEISRRYCRGEMTVEETYKELKQIKGKQYSVAVYNLATILVPVGFAPLFGGGVKETLVSAAVGCILAFLITLGKKIQMSSFILNAICAFGVAVTAACVNRVTSGWNLGTDPRSGKRFSGTQDEQVTWQWNRSAGGHRPVWMRCTASDSCDRKCTGK